MRLEAVVKVGRQRCDAFSVTSAVHVPLFSMETELARPGIISRTAGPTQWSPSSVKRIWVKIASLSRDFWPVVFFWEGKGKEGLINSSRLGFFADYL